MTLNSTADRRAPEGAGRLGSFAIGMAAALAVGLPAVLLARHGAPDLHLAAARTSAVVQEARALPVAGQEVAGFYEARRGRPLWLHGRRLDPAAGQLLQALRAAQADGLAPVRYDSGRLAALMAQARWGDRKTLARLEVALSETLALYVRDLHTPVAPARTIVTDRSVAGPELSTRAILEAAARAPSLGAYLASARRMNPLYQAYRRELAAWRAHHPGPPDSHERLILANMERARGLPPDLGRRYMLVDAAGADLRIFEDGRQTGAMKVIVGKKGEPTPLMSGAVRFAIFDPYWNIPPDLVRDKVAPKVLSRGPGYLASQRFQVLSDWSDHAAVLDPAKVDWAGVAAGAVQVHVRQLPGPGNMMGEVKFMLPNRLGIYLHDTPNKAPFSGGGRHLSSGCVRLSDASRMSQWLLGKPLSPAASAPAPRWPTHTPAARSRRDMKSGAWTSEASISRWSAPPRPS